jgi:UDP-N-acetylglucosamine--N-acetylmuramyl-(pentapeptide) pyrophosphoryl-undecaprenol N-acetylglucosamine transferase
MRVVFTGGGTGGHLYPALALARHIRQEEPAAEIIFLGTERGLESRIVPREGFRFKTLAARRPGRRFSRAMLRSLSAIAAGTREAYRFLRWFSPDVVVGTGGYTSVPAALAALLRRVPVVLHEQNVIPGLVNRKLSPFAAVTCLSFPESQPHFPARARTVVTGNPRASEAAAAPLVVEEDYFSLGLLPGRRTLLMAGGSQGALNLNRVALKALGRLQGRRDLQVLYVTGHRYFEEMKARAGDLSPEPLLKLVPYLENMPRALGLADIIISRAGATTLAEINARGVPALLVPSPNVVDDHQMVNARVQEAGGAALVYREAELTAAALAQGLLSLLDNPERLQAMREASYRLGYPGAAAAMYRVLKGLPAP